MLLPGLFGGGTGAGLRDCHANLHRNRNADPDSVLFFSHLHRDVVGDANWHPLPDSYANFYVYALPHLYSPSYPDSFCYRYSSAHLDAVSHSSPSGYRYVHFLAYSYRNAYGDPDSYSITKTNAAWRAP